VRPLGDVKVKGKERPVKIYELLGREGTEGTKGTDGTEGTKGTEGTEA